MEVSDLGSWNLDIHHRYNYQQGVLQKGDGTAVFFKQQARIVQPLIGSSDRSARSPNCPANECEGRAKSAKLADPIALTAGPDGSVFVGDGNMIRRITPEGYVITVFRISTRNRVNGLPVTANTAAGHASTSGKKGNTSASSYNYHMQLSPYDHHLYVADPERQQILRIHTIDRVEDPESNYDIFVGSGSRCLPRDPTACGDGGSALEAKLSFPKGMAFGLDGSLYFADGNSIRLVDRRGHIDTVIGSSSHMRRRNQWQPIPCHGSLPADQVTLRWPTELAMHPIDASLYFIDDHMLLKLLPDQRVTVVAGLPSYCRSAGRDKLPGNSDRRGGGRNHQSDEEEEDVTWSTTGKTWSSAWRRNHRKQQDKHEKQEKQESEWSAGTADIGSVISFSFSFSGDLFVASVDDAGVHRLSLIRDSRSRQQVIHFLGSPTAHTPADRPSSPSSLLCELESCRGSRHNCSNCALGAQEILSSFTVSANSSSIPLVSGQHSFCSPVPAALIASMMHETGQGFSGCTCVPRKKEQSDYILSCGTIISVSEWSGRMSSCGVVRDEPKCRQKEEVVPEIRRWPASLTSMIPASLSSHRIPFPAPVLTAMTYISFSYTDTGQ